MNYLKKFCANQEGRDFVCGDIHGQLRQLYQAMAEVAFDPNVDRLFSVGDLVDRGAQSKNVFELLHEPWFHAVRGNHEAMMFDAYQSREPRVFSSWMKNGGQSWVKSDVDFFDKDPHFSMLVDKQCQELPWAIELSLRDGRAVGLVHAECPCDDWSDLEPMLQSEGQEGIKVRRDSLWARSIKEPLFGETVANIDLTVHGHTVFPNPIRRSNRCYIDTGACLHSNKFWRLIKKSRGYLSLIKVENLFDIPQHSWQTLFEMEKSC
ncbi:metallophosphoesterase [Motiliproteus sp. MSK22-1]|uniref:metallophosphoesterase n=1 Tax=Motiliproteus sp. MSK22-1 TaxID=1897630 RepID=UPI0009777B5B|nr:metallophosphoesterase [Motiliproteus sp. MSK22-1]OMH39717.1 hypothetical protein BGP75_01250 [Motiliproteus sp. MSK22-1]